VRSSHIRRELGVEPLLLLHVKRSQLWWFRHLIRMIRQVRLEGDPGADPEPAGQIIYLIWPGNASGSPRRSWKVLLGRRKSGGPCFAFCHWDPAPDKWMKMDEWMDGYSELGLIPKVAFSN